MLAEKLMEFIQSIIDHEKDLIHALRDGADENRQAELDSMLRKFKEIEKSDLTAFFDDMNLIKNDYPKLFGFSAYWSNQEAIRNAIAKGKDPEYYAEAHYSKQDFEEAMQKFEYVNRSSAIL